ncbi:MAG: hypothetical protein PHV07_09395 [Oscillospiraceae bacterium]|nr:hypothetical protein [Oscillospiraceae bacterium]
MLDQQFTTLTEMLDQDTSCYDFYVGLPEDIKKGLQMLDISSFEEMQKFAAEHKGDNLVIPNEENVLDSAL